MATWTTREGQALLITEMADDHLLNTERFLRRQIADAWASQAACQGMVFLGEQANLEADREADRLWDAAEEMERKAAELLEEIQRRGLKPRTPNPQQEGR